ncbi:MAG TPA: ABC transporter ATP-binding protein [Candidatus Dormibacteraeota bacterium]|nr:ABC transporter ATP-binding protein [Candidatus Dormibacteraeota bacterium]
MTEPLLEVKNLSVDFLVDDDIVSAVSDVSLDVSPGEILGLVGESGCGKTTLAMAIMRLLAPNARTQGSIRFRGIDLLQLSEADCTRLRGDQIGMIFQDPLSSLDPAFGIGSQVADTIETHRRVSGREARTRALALLREVGIPSPQLRYGDPPHRFSGGMRQRVVIAAALANEPALVLADEPTSALDVTIQAQILTLLKELAVHHHTTVVLIAHDLGIVAQLCNRVGVMYAGQLVELAPVSEIFGRPLHPYTQALLGALPTARQAPGSLRVIEGQIPNLAAPPPGCRFAPRCAHRMDVCIQTPVLETQASRHSVACWLYPGQNDDHPAGQVDDRDR